MLYRHYISHSKAPALYRGAWVAQLSIPFQLSSLSPSSWLWALCQALCWQLRAWSLLQILCLLLSAPLLPILCLSLSLSKKKINIKIQIWFGTPLTKDSQSLEARLPCPPLSHLFSILISNNISAMSLQELICLPEPARPGEHLHTPQNPAQESPSFLLMPTGQS